ncbi:hypothetical protein RND81_02G202600 [Saponaria officinalis]|uniref:Uncharacterized protein n=1 Tax=Saponaria officinalis TaxID=3572 RepID=A0AAW1MRV2_SAPOF
MIPNLDLILLAFLHGAFISCILLVVIFVIVNCLLTAFIIALFFFAFVDVYDDVLLLLPYVETLRANLMLGGVWALYNVLHCAFVLVFTIKAWLVNVLSVLKPRS